MTDIFNKTTTNTIIRYINHKYKCRWFWPFFILKENEIISNISRRIQHTLQYCFVAKISYEPRQSSGRWYQSIRRPLWSRWLKYSFYIPCYLYFMEYYWFVYCNIDNILHCWIWILKVNNKILINII